jgi:hypothetical protein
MREITKIAPPGEKLGMPVTETGAVAMMFITGLEAIRHKGEALITPQGEEYYH